ncbi:DNA-binding transcriptional activator of the SARP family [Microbispora rosea]|uniref:DNA-binding transcriptional activator of the SARP family n=1 Tax=Microbispora rosea TaxID=58117 RepID=A0A1N7FZD1_9ACTN|nr:AfsR/SARP family transcriptional regulator [Microbispora rosea]GIH51136.1 regulatory protein AfsR [Microbispora rosea subsp. rosea]SIS05681.1 DNA-binding transcriptional activator of the SARP family [Microbispora rosea]
MPDHAAADGLRFAVLGPVLAWRDGVELDLGTPLQRSILAMLLLREGHAVTPDEMIDGVWGEDAPPRALGALRTYVSRLRTVLEPDRSPRTPPRLLTSVGRGYALRLGPDQSGAVQSGAARFDLAVFERECAAAESDRRKGRADEAARRLRGALRLWSGEPLTGAVGPFAEHQRDRLAERRMSAVETLMELDLELGRHAEIVSELVALAAEHPLRERLRAQLMLAYYRCGRQAEALSVFTETRHALVEELGIEPGADLALLHRRILAADPSLAPTPPPVRLSPQDVHDDASATETGPAIEMPRPAQLPAAVPDFTGRTGLVRRLLALLRGEGAREGVPIAAMSGIGGVGKTTLAVHVAHLADDLFPDGQLYADLRGYGAEPTAPETALVAFLRALGIPMDVIPDGLAERSALFRSLLADRRMLVLLDNARDAEQVEHLLPGSAGCAAIITSRGKLADLPAARLVDLDVMEPEEALSLLAAVAGPERVAAERAAAMDVVAACGFLPLAVRIVAARLASRPSWTVASLVPRLADERRRLDEMKIGNLAVSATFALGYGQLDARQARAFRLLSLPSGSGISVFAAAAVLDLTPAAAEDVIESLVDASLLEAPAPGRYRFHDLLKLFARRQAEDAEEPAARALALRRLLGFYLASAGAAHRLAYEGSAIADNLTDMGVRGHSFSSADEAVAWLSAEAEDMFGAVAQTAGAQDVPGGDLLAAADLLLAMEPLLESGTNQRDFEQRTSALLTATRGAGERRGEVRCRYVLGRVLFGANRLAEAESHFLAARTLGEETGDHIVLGETCNALAVVAGRRRRHTEALEWFDRATAVHRETGNPAGEALASCYSARDHLGLGRPDDAIAAAERGLAVFSEIGSGAGMARARYHLGNVLSYVGRLNEAVVHHAECLAFFRASNQRVWEQRVCYRLAATFIAAGRYAEAARHAEQALTVSREITHPYGEAQSLAALGKALASLGETGRGRQALVKALDIFTRLGSPEADDIRALLREQVET